MKKILVPLYIFSLSFILTISAAAGDSVKNVHVQVRTGLSCSLASAYITPDVSVLYSPSITRGLVSFGAGVKTVFGIKYGDVYVAPYGVGELGWFSLGLGTAIEAKGPNQGSMATASNDFPAFISAGFYPRIAAGPGWIVFGGNIDIFPTASPVIEGENFLGTLLITLFGASFNIIKAEAGIGYRITF